MSKLTMKCKHCGGLIIPPGHQTDEMLYQLPTCECKPQIMVETDNGWKCNSCGKINPNYAHWCDCKGSK